MKNKLESLTPLSAEEIIEQAKPILKSYLDVDNTPMEGNEWILDVVHDCVIIQTAQLRQQVEELGKQNLGTSLMYAELKERNEKMEGELEDAKSLLKGTTFHLHEESVQRRAILIFLEQSLNKE